MDSSSIVVIYREGLANMPFRYCQGRVRRIVDVGEDRGIGAIIHNKVRKR